MNSKQVLTLVLALVLLVAPMMAFKPVFAAPPMSCDVTWSGAANINTTDPYHILELANTTLVGSTFTLEVHLLNANVGNAPAGVLGAEVHMDFSRILPWATLTSVVDDTANLFGSGALMGIPFGVYEIDGVTKVNSPYTNGVQIIFAGAGSGSPYNGNDVTLFTCTFTLNTKPDFLSNPIADPINEAFLNMTAFADPTANPIPTIANDGFLQLQRLTFAYPPIPVISIAPAAATGSLTIGTPISWVVSLTSAPFWDIAGYDINVTWDPTLLAYLTYTDGNFLTMNGDPIFSFNNTYTGGIEIVSTKLSDMVYSNSKVPVTGTLFTLTLTNLNVSTVYPPPSCHVTLAFTDLVSWAHPEYGITPWFGSLTAVDVPYSGTLDSGPPGTHTIASPGYSIYTEGYLPQGANIDLYDQYPAPYGGQGRNMESDSFAPQAEVCLYANVTYAQDRVSNKLVVFQINNALGQKVTILQNYTDINGIATVCYRLPMSDYDIGGLGNGTWDPAIFGDWNVIATVEVDQITFNDTMSIPVGWLVQVVQVTANNAPYLKYGGIPMNFTAYVTTIHEQPLTVLLSVDSYDTQGYPIGETSWWATLTAGRNVTTGLVIPTTYIYGAYAGTYYGWGNAPYGPYQQVVTSGNSIYQGIPTWARVGLASVVGYALTDYPANGGTPYGPQSNADGTTTTFFINLH